MNRTIKIIIAIVCVIAAYFLIASLTRGRGLNFADLEHSDEQKNFEKKLMAKQQAIDSLGKIYRGTFVTLKIPANFNGDNDKIILLGAPSINGANILSPGDGVQLIDVLPQYQFKPNDQVPRILRNADIKVKTNKGITGLIPHYYVDEFESVLKEKGLETDLR